MYFFGYLIHFYRGWVSQNKKTFSEIAMHCNRIVMIFLKEIDCKGRYQIVTSIYVVHWHIETERHMILRFIYFHRLYYEIEFFQIFMAPHICCRFLTRAFWRTTDNMKQRVFANEDICKRKVFVIFLLALLLKDRTNRTWNVTTLFISCSIQQ